MKYAFIKAELTLYPLSFCCWVLGLTTSGYYAWGKRSPSARAIAKASLGETIRTIFNDQKGRYGAPRINRTLRKHHGYTGSLNRIQALMRAMGLRAKAAKRYQVTTDSGHSLPVAANLLGQDFSCDASPESTSHAKAPDQVWLSDITYLWTSEGWLFACCVLDLFTRKIVGWSMEPHMSREMVLAAMTMAYQNRRQELNATAHALIFHSDRGSQYASQDVRSWLAERGMKQSMSGTGNCYDNAPMESFWHSLKVEETHGQHFATRAEARHCVFAYIEGFYNTKRMHSSLGYQSPIEFEREFMSKATAANDETLLQNSQTARLTKRVA